MVLYQKVLQWLHQFGVSIALGNVSTQLVKAQHIAQHAQKMRVDQVAALGKYGAQGRATPFQRTAPLRAGHLDRKRHVGLGSLHAQFGKQGNQVRVGTLVKHQKPGVHPMRYWARGAGQGDIYGVGVAAKIVAGLKQGDVCAGMQAMRNR